MLERKAAAGAILAGITLHRVKASLPHGAFGPWIAQKLTRLTSWTPGTAKVNASFYMRLSLTFVEKVRVDKSMLLALPHDGESLDLGASKEAKKLASALEKFVGDCSLTELLIKHGIKGVGLKTALEQGDEDETDDSATPAQLAEQTRMEALQWVSGLHKAISDPNRFQHLTSDPKTLRTLHNEIVEIKQRLDERIRSLAKK